MAAWGTSTRQRLRLLPLYLATRLADTIAGWLPAHRAEPQAPWPAGVTVIIPERDAPQMLAQALGALFAALARVHEPVQVVVVANGAPASRYDEVRARFPAVEWITSEAPLGFAQAVEAGLVLARHEATYLLNNDMLLAPDALERVLEQRTPDCFAIASQIFQRSADGRREETGFTDWYAGASGVHLFHAEPDAAGAAVVPHLAASGGATLFRTSLLRRYLPASRAYDPFYWEDAEWGVRAWRDGYRVLFCAASHATHRHRASTARFYDAGTLARIVERNRVLFDLRQGASGSSAAQALAAVCHLPYESQRELSRLRCAAGVLRWRSARLRAPQPLPPPRFGDAREASRIESSYSFHLLEPAAARARPRVLYVAPFAVFPPRHGGARRVAAWIRGTKDAFAVSLLGDESSLYDPRSFAGFDGLAHVRLVQRDDRGVAAADLPSRMRAHCHAAMRAALHDALREWKPEVVIVEHAELAPLVRERAPGVRFVLDLHDAYAADDFAHADDAAAFARDVAAYDAVFVCSEEDRALVAHPRIIVLPNGAESTGIPAPTTGAGLLFVGPFRYAPNRDGILRFLRDAWPHVRAQVPEATLTILGGDEGRNLAASEPLLRQEGVTVHGHRDDVPAVLAACALAINPLAGIRGSAVKLAETLAAGRVCVSTREGARGFADTGGEALVIAGDVPAMVAPIVRLLQDPRERHCREAAITPATFGWHHAQQGQRDCLHELLRTR